MADFAPYLTDALINSTVKGIHFAHKAGLRALLKAVRDAIAHQRTTSVAKLDLTIGGAYSQTNEKAIHDKVNDLIDAMVAGGLMDKSES